MRSEPRWQRPPDHLDFAYVRPDCAGEGVAAALYDALIEHANAAGATRLRSEASELARRFLERRGWRTDGRNDFERDGESLHNYSMSVEL